PSHASGDASPVGGLIFVRVLVGNRVVVKRLGEATSQFSEVDHKAVWFQIEQLFNFRKPGMQRRSVDEEVTDLLWARVDRTSDETHVFLPERKRGSFQHRAGLCH